MALYLHPLKGGSLFFLSGKFWGYQFGSPCFCPFFLWGSDSKDTFIDILADSVYILVLTGI